jgi:hypothetical protein
MFQRIIRRTNYIINNTPFLFSTKIPTITKQGSSKIYFKNYLKNAPSVGRDPDWKIKELVKRELEKEGVHEKKARLFSGLVGILFFIVFLYERRII